MSFFGEGGGSEALFGIEKVCSRSADSLKAGDDRCVIDRTNASHQ